MAKKTLIREAVNVDVCPESEESKSLYEEGTEAFNKYLSIKQGKAVGDWSKYYTIAIDKFKSAREKGSIEAIRGLCLVKLDQVDSEESFYSHELINVMARYADLALISPDRQIPLGLEHYLNLGNVTN